MFIHSYLSGELLSLIMKLNSELQGLAAVSSVTEAGAAPLWLSFFYLGVISSSVLSAVTLLFFSLGTF